MTAIADTRSDRTSVGARAASVAAGSSGPDPAIPVAATIHAAPGWGPHNVRSGHSGSDTRCTGAAADFNSRDDQAPDETQRGIVVAGHNLPPANHLLAPNAGPPAAPSIPDGQAMTDAHAPLAVGEQHWPATERVPASVVAVSLAGTNTRGGQDPPDAQNGPAAAGQAGQPATIHRTTPETRPSLADPFLYLAAQAVDDLEKLRKASQNRLRILTTDAPDDDGITRGFGLTEAHPAVAAQAALAEGVARLEHQAVLELQRRMRKHPLGPWGKAQRGIGEKQLARLLAVIGDPYWNTAADRPRTVSALWAYAGYRPGAKRQKGQRCNWSTEAKTRAYLIAESCMKAGGPYRDVYDRRRGHTAAVHPEWTDGHSHTDALRIAAKAILRDLWREASRLHGGEAL